MGSVRVLVVDDHAIVRHGVAVLLESEGDIEIVGTAATGEEAVAMVAELAPDVAIVGDSLPQMSGVEVCGAVTERHPDTVVVGLSGHVGDAVAQQFVEAGARGYLVKDIDGLGLGQAVRAAAKGQAVFDPHLTARLLCWADRRSRSARGSLAPRELDVLRLVADGATNKEVARRLHLSENTVKTYVQRMFEKLECRSRTEAAAVAARKGLL